MPAYPLAVINEGNVPEAEVVAFVAAAQEYLGKWLAAFWPEVVGSTIHYGNVGSSDCHVVLAPTTTVANSMGYHERTPDGKPIGIVELDACWRYGEPWTVAATHEIAEMLINPDLTRFVRIGNKNFPVESADPTTADRFAINGVKVSNVSTPAFWNLTSGTRYDIMARVRAPLPTIPHGGWMEWAEGGTYQNAWGADLSPRLIAYLAERQGRRWQLRQKALP